MKNTLKVIIMLAGSLGFTYGQTVKRKMRLISFPNGDESITIVEKGNTKVLKLVSKDEENGFSSLELSNHEIAHQEAPGKGKVLDSLNFARGIYSLREEKSKKRGEGSRDPLDEDHS